MTKMNQYNDKRLPRKNCVVFIILTTYLVETFKNSI